MSTFLKSINSARRYRPFREDLLQRRFFRAIADGNPVHDGETYTKQDYASLHGTLWLQLVRGGNAGYLFLWCKRAWDPRWTPPGSPEGGRRLAELMQFHILNPWAFPTAGLKAIMDVKKEMLALDDLFVPRQNYRRPEIGLLLSYPTERRAPAIGNTVKNEVRDTATVLDFLHYPYGVLLEEQTERFTPERFPVLIASGIRKGTRVIVSGRYVQRDWQTETGERRSSYELNVDDLGASVRYATVQITKATANAGMQHAPLVQPQQQTAQPTNDPWHTATQDQFAEPQEPAF